MQIISILLQRIFLKALEIYKKIKFLDASFNVRKWKTNNPDLQNYFNKMENHFSPTSEIQANNKVKVLEIVWDTKSDHLVFSFENLIESLTILFQQIATF